MIIKLWAKEEKKENVGENANTLKLDTRQILFI